MRSALIAAALLALVLCGCSSGQPQEIIDMVAKMESNLASMEKELAEVKAMVVDLKSELSTCKIELQAFAQQKLQEEEAQAAAKIVQEEAPAVPEQPTTKLSKQPIGAVE